MGEEFLESDVVFSYHRNPPCFDDDDREHHVLPPPQQQQQQQHNSRAVICGNKSSVKNRGRSAKTVANSLPVNIPERMFRCSDSDSDELVDEDEEGIVPPHVIVGRRIAGKMAFSVCTGNGRTLKGRDLSQVRNSILRMTGFLEA